MLLSVCLEGHPDNVVACGSGAHGAVGVGGDSIHADDILVQLIHRGTVPYGSHEKVEIRQGYPTVVSVIEIGEEGDVVGGIVGLNFF